MLDQIEARAPHTKRLIPLEKTRTVSSNIQNRMGFAPKVRTTWMFSFCGDL